MRIGKIIFTCAFVYLLGISSVFAATVDHFEVSLYPLDAKTGEALDLTINAVDVNNVTVTDYTGMVLLFSESDPEAELPIVLEDNTYTFKATDQGKILFENAIKFTKAGTQNIYIYDFNEDTVFGMAEANISTSGEVASSAIELIAPENGVILGENKVMVSGSSESNHQVNIILNSGTGVLAMTNDSGVFEKEISNLKEGDNTISAQVLDANGNVIGTSSTVSIRVERNTVSLTNVRAIPEEIDAESAYEIEAIATPTLREVEAIVNDVIVKLTEGDSGVYSARTYAPLEEGTYTIDVILRDDLGREIKELGAGSIKVNPILNAAGEEVVEPPVTTDNEPIKIIEKDLKIEGLKLVQLKSKSILTWDKLEDAVSYNVYKKLEDGELEFIMNVDEPKFEVLIDMEAEEVKYEYFAVKAVAEDEDGEEYEGDLSEATKIQTGPEMILLLFLALIIGGLFFYVKDRKRA